MALTTAQRTANYAARKRGLPEPYKKDAKPSADEIGKRLDQHKVDYDWAQQQDATGTFYKSECRSYTDLLAIYYGADILDKESDDDEETTAAEKRKKKEKKENRPNPSKHTITIKAIALPDGTKIEPTCLKDCDHTAKDGSCSKVYRHEWEANGLIPFRRWLDLRDKARKDLLWLGRLLGKGLFHSVHQYVCDLFVQKNFDGLYFPGYNLDDFHDMMRRQKRYANVGTDVVMPGLVECREMILLEQRGGYKSTIDGIDAVSWMINCPDARIMLMTAFRSLSKKFLKEVKRYFYVPKRAEPTAFNLLFPEYSLFGKDGTSDASMKCPARVVWSKEDSIWQTSAESSVTGDHCDILKFDDIVDPKNSSDVEQRAALKYLADSFKKDNLDPWGFVDGCGTRYFTDDYYGTRLLANKETKRIAPLLWSSRGCWELSPEDQILYNMGSLSLSEIITQKRGKLIFPYNRGWAELRDILDDKDERNFKNQQLNEATDAETDELYINHFTEDILRKHMYAASAAPERMKVNQYWDTAYGGQDKGSDFSAAATIGIYQNKEDLDGLVVLNVMAEKIRASELPFKIVAFYEEQKRMGRNVENVFIENALGVDFLLVNVKNEAFRRGSDIFAKIHKRPISLKPNAKLDRIRDLEFLLGRDRLWFVMGAWIDKTFGQLMAYTGKKSTAYRKDDIPDVISFAVEHLSKTSLVFSPDQKEIEKEKEAREKKASMESNYRRMFDHNAPGYVSTGRSWGRPPSVSPLPVAMTKAPEPNKPSAAGSWAKLGNAFRAPNKDSKP